MFLGSLFGRQTGEGIVEKVVEELLPELKMKIILELLDIVPQRMLPKRVG